MKTILPAIGVVEATEPAQYLLTPFQQGHVALQAFLDNVIARKPKAFRSMTYGTTLQPFFQSLDKMQRVGIPWHGIFDHVQAMGRAEKKELEWLASRGLKDGHAFVLGTTPLHHAINHLKACWDSDGYVFNGSWNYSVSADSQYNVIEIVHSPEVASAYDAAFDFAWNWIQGHEGAYQVIEGGNSQ